jgi:hypothetical protein
MRRAMLCSNPREAQSRLRVAKRHRQSCSTLSLRSASKARSLCSRGIASVIPGRECNERTRNLLRSPEIGDERTGLAMLADIGRKLGIEP